MEIKQSTRIQTSLLNGVEKKALVWMASRMPQWVTSDMLTWFVLLFRRNNPLRHAGHHRNGHPVHPCNLLFRQFLQGSALVRSERSVNQTSERWAGIKA